MLHYKTYIKGDKHPWVTFIHGAGGSSSVWFKQIKEFRKAHNVLLLDLRGHGRSERGRWKKGDSFREVADDVVEVMDKLGIGSSHMIGMSLGTIVAQTLAERHPDRVKSLILGGAVIGLDIRTKLLLWAGNTFKRFVPYMLLYKLFAYIIMPKKEHEESRLAFVNQAKKMCQKEFVKWFSLTKLINPYLARLQSTTTGVPTLFLMGEEDYLFIPPVEEVVRRSKKFRLITIRNSGHVCNIDQPDAFNRHSIRYIREMESAQERSLNFGSRLSG
ncbi:putative carboxylesterase nap [Bhargavaea cecembensis DSE10]|uniref:Putative carboxylesterase nap n=1 Tax=Bhargavaea cecembensis DSE10 TaxID=1235279 RepID=M7NEQ8_9BACL|nr:alpha/beta hydrolase [Bhargavaea cecembensis]EMR07053.1 putative carboxylesterase nap [Bhargavaea cecembensis DSE10]